MKPQTLPARLIGGVLLVGLCALAGCDVQETTDPDLGDAFDPGTDAGVRDRGVPDVDLGFDPCESAEDCADPTPVCRRVAGEPGRCVECLDSTFCPRTLPVCGLDDTCVRRDPAQCREDFDCAASAPRCVVPGSDAVGICVLCATDGDCGGGTPRCSAAGRCVSSAASVPCTGDAECGPRRLCEAGACTF